MKNIILNQMLTVVSAATITTLVGLSSCTGDFDQINTNPDGIPPQNIPVESRFSQPMQSIYLNYQNRDFEYQLAQNLNCDLYAGYLEVPTPFNGNNNNSTYLMNEGWNNMPFKVGALYIMKPIADILKNTELVDYIALAKIIRVAGVQRTTDVYGPIPYSQAMQGGQSVPYDSQEDVYKSFFLDLKESVDNLTAFLQTPEAAITPTRINSFDIMCDGSYIQWIRFANTLRLRLAMRIVKVNPALAKTEAEAAVNQTYGVLTNADNSVSAKSTTLTNPLQVISFGYNDTRIGAPYVCMLQGYNDPRLAATVKPIGWFKNEDIKDVNGDPLNQIGKYIGIRQGIIIPDKSNYEMYSVVNMDEKDNSSFENPLPIMNVSEAYFLRAEGALRGWNMGGSDAKTFYEAGILQAFKEKGITDMSLYNDYITNDTDLPADYVDPFNPANNIANANDLTIKWDETADNETKLQRIITQKWISIFPEGQEGWSDFRRTGYPKLFPVASNRSNGVIPDGEFIKRLKFTEEERNTNLPAVEEATTLLGGPDNINTRLWWDVAGGNF
jgi:hypothetical protein